MEQIAEKTRNNMGGTDIKRFLLPVFSLATLYFITVDVLADSAVMRVSGENAVLPVHLSYLLAQAIGFLIFSLLQKFTTTLSARRFLLFGIYLLSVFTLCGFSFINSFALLTVFILINLFLSGIIGASVYYYAAYELKGYSHKGRFCGTAIGVAAMLQVILSIASLPEWLNAVILSAALIVCGVITFLKIPSAMPASDSNFVPEKPLCEKKYIITLIIIVAVISVMGGINDGTLTIMQTRHAISLYSFPRLFYFVGVISAGIIADYKEKRYLYISILTIMLCATVGILFLGNSALVNINACIYSLLAGFAIIFFTVPFLDAAAASEKPALIAGLGRAVRLLFMIPGTALMEYCLKNYSFYITIGVFIFLSVMLVLLFWAGGFLSAVHDAPDTYKTPVFDKDGLAGFAVQYKLTPRESETLERLLTTEDSVQQIADSMFISRRVLQRYIASIYEKTQTKSRIGLFQLYASVSGSLK